MLAGLGRKGQWILMAITSRCVLSVAGRAVRDNLDIQ